MRISEDTEALVLSILDGSAPPLSGMDPWVEEYMRLEHKTDMGQGDQVVDARMNVIYDFLLKRVEARQLCGWLIAGTGIPCTCKRGHEGAHGND